MQKGARLHRHRTPVVNWLNVVESLDRAFGYEARVSRLAAVLLLMHTIHGQQKNKAESKDISKNTGKNATPVTDKVTRAAQTPARYTSFNGYLREKFLRSSLSRTNRRRFHMPKS